MNLRESPSTRTASGWTAKLEKFKGEQSKEREREEDKHIQTFRGKCNDLSFIFNSIRERAS